MIHIIVIVAMITVAAICTAVMDTLAFHRSVSIWQKSGSFWTVDQHRIMVFKYPVNAWHISKSLMLLCLFSIWPFYKVVIHPVADILIGGFWFIQVFNLFFNHILKKNATS
jgi:hypothetical protein